MNEDNELTLGEICKVIFKRIWWVFGATVVGLIAFALIIKFVYNVGKEYYSVSYEFSCPGLAEGTYPDGTVFTVSDLVSLDAINAVKKAGGEKFEKLDADEIYDGCSISVTSKDDAVLAQKSLTLKVRADVFSSSSQASDFIKALAAYPVTMVGEKMAAGDYSANLNAYPAVSTYSDRLDLLSAQKQDMLEAYNSLIELTGSRFMVDGKSLAAYRLEIENTFRDYIRGEEGTVPVLIEGGDRDKLENEISVKCLVLDPEAYLAAAGDDVRRLQSDVDKLDRQIQAQKDEAGANPASAYASAISSLVGQKARKELEIDEIIEHVCKITRDDTVTKDNLASKNLTMAQAYIDENEAFRQKLDGDTGYVAQLANGAAALKSVCVSVYESKTAISLTGNRVTKYGGMSSVLGAVIGAVIGFVLASVVVGIIDVPKYRRQKEALAAQGGQSSPEEAPVNAPEKTPDEDGGEQIS